MGFLIRVNEAKWIKIGVLHLVMTKERQGFIIVWATTDEVGDGEERNKVCLGFIGMEKHNQKQKRTWPNIKSTNIEDDQNIHGALPDASLSNQLSKTLPCQPNFLPLTK